MKDVEDTEEVFGVSALWTALFRKKWARDLFIGSSLLRDENNNINIFVRLEETDWNALGKL